MDTFELDFGNIAAGLFLTSFGLIAILISLFRLRSRDFTLLNFGIFCTLYGIRWLVEIPTMKSLVGFPFTFPYFHGLLTYALVIPFSAFLVNIFGRGLYDSLIWVLRSTIVYTVAAVAYDLFRPEPVAEASINAAVIVLWCVIWIVNLFAIKKQDRVERRVFQVVFTFVFVGTAVDNLFNLRALPGGSYIEHVSILALCIGLGYVAIRHFLSTEKKLLAVEQEIEIARRIQYSNLPGSLHPPDELDIAARYIPMTTVAGDFYDVHVREKKGVGFFIADVSGHGVGAALIGSMLKVAFASQVEYIHDPGRVLTEINRILCGKIETSYVTACSVYIDIDDRKLLYAVAGHPPPILRRKSENELLRLTHGGTILGLFPESVYKHATVDLVKADRLILYTDGLTETQNRNGEFFGDERLAAFIRDGSHDTAGMTADSLTAYLAEWAGKADGGSLDDDLTILIIDVVS
jgi:phosphoserine phosphatase RsbU/P